VSALDVSKIMSFYNYQNQGNSDILISGPDIGNIGLCILIMFTLRKLWLNLMF